jgi:hypothetical protein
VCSSDLFQTTIGDLLMGDKQLLLKGDAIVAYAEALKDARDTNAPGAKIAILEAALATVQTALAALAGDPDLLEIEGLLTQYRDNASF